MGDKDSKIKPADELSFGYMPEAEQLELENRILKERVSQLQHEVSRLHEPALMVCEISEIVGDNAIIRVQNGNQFFVNISSTAKNLKPGDTVLCEQKNLSVIRKTHSTKQFDVDKFIIIEKPQIAWSDIGGLKREIQEIQEVVELPLNNPDLFRKVGIDPPKGVLLHGPPGTGKTLLAKAVAAATNSTFIELVGSELVQKFIGEGAKLIKEMFAMAREKAPAVIFIDEIDAIAAKRIEVGTSGEREVQRTFMQLLAELDGFDPLGDIKIIGCTNRLDILDPAITRPGRLDRLIEVDKPDIEGIKQIFSIHTKRMSLSPKVKSHFDRLVKEMVEMSGAEIKSVCTEAGYFAIRENKKVISVEHFENAIVKVRRGEKKDTTHKIMFG